MEGPGGDGDATGRRRKRTESPAHDPRSKQHRSATTASPSESKQKPAQEVTLAYLRDLKENVDGNTYQEFLKIMKDILAGRACPIECVKRVKEMLKGHPDLLLGFNNFLPWGRVVTSPRSPFNEAGMQDALDLVLKVKSRFSKYDKKYRSFLRIFDMYQTNHISSAEANKKVMALLQDHDDLLEEFMYVVNLSERVPSSKPFRHEDEGRPTNTNDAQGEKEERTLKLHADCDLSSGLNDLEHSKSRKYPQTHSMVSKDWKDYRSGKMSTTHRKNSKNLLLVQKPSPRFDNREIEPLQHGEEVCQARAVKQEETFMAMEHERDDMRGKLSENDSAIQSTRLGKGGLSLSKAEDPYRNNLFRENGKCDPGRSDLELDLSNNQRVGPSYCLLPNECRLAPPSCRSKLGVTVLNDRLECASSGSESHPFKIMHKNKYEECLFRIEDDRFELDILLKRLTSTVEKVEQLLQKVQSGEDEKEIANQLGTKFTSHDWRCIELLYNDHRLHFVDILYENVSATLPVLLIRLKQKQEEVFRKRSDSQKIWAEIFAKNYPRSLDHRSSYFSQQDPGKETKATIVSSEPKVAARLNNDVLQRTADTKETSNYCLHRNIRKCNCDTEHSATCKAMEGIQAVNGISSAG